MRSSVLRRSCYEEVVLQGNFVMRSCYNEAFTWHCKMQHIRYCPSWTKVFRSSVSASRIFLAVMYRGNQILDIEADVMPVEIPDACRLTHVRAVSMFVYWILCFFRKIQRGIWCATSKNYESILRSTSGWFLEGAGVQHCPWPMLRRTLSELRLLFWEESSRFEGLY